jgi:hypothetical protein
MNLANHKRKQIQLLCTPCRDAAEQQKKQDAKQERDIGRQDAKRAQEIKRALTTPGAWKCKCGSRLGHAERCPLFPQQPGERRWPGKNKGVTEADLEFGAKRRRHE